MGNGSKIIYFDSISFGDLKPLVELAFGDDPKLISDYQQLKTDIGETVHRNLRNILDANSDFDFEYFRIMLDDAPIGFFVADINESLLFSFGINIKHRTDDIKKQWFEALRVLFNDDFRTILWNENTRAINFMKKSGMHVIYTTGYITILNFSKI